MTEKLIVIGSGPAAWTAAIYAARADLRPLVFEGAASNANYLAGTLPLGQLNLTTEVENFPGFADGVDGHRLVAAMRAQAVRFGTRVLTRDVADLRVDARPLALTDSEGGVTHAHAVAVATGASARYLGLPTEGRFRNRGVSACAVCDGPLPRFAGRPAVVVGGGDSACEEALYLARFASVVHLVHRRDRLRASRVMADRVLAHPGVRPQWDAIVTEVLGDDEHGVTGVRLADVRSGAARDLEAAGLFVAIGHVPATGFLGGRLATVPPTGHLLLEPPSEANGHARTRTSAAGVFAAGDVADPHYRQAITAAASGCMAALDAERWLAASGLAG
jgi:thioredoxin reductase (NADPH)